MELMTYLRAQWDRAGAVVATVLGLVVLLLGYLGTSHTEYIAEQIPYLLSGGLLAIMLLTVGAVLWLSADLRDEWREMAEQGEAIRQEQLDRRGALNDYVDEQITAKLSEALRDKGISRRRASAPLS